MQQPPSGFKYVVTKARKKPLGVGVASYQFLLCRTWHSSKFLWQQGGMGPASTGPSPVRGNGFHSSLHKARMSAISCSTASSRVAQLVHRRMAVWSSSTFAQVE